MEKIEIGQPTSGAEYRAKRRKLITLPSGDKFLLKKPGKTALVELMKILGAQVAAENVKDLDFESMVEASKEVQLSTEQLASLIDLLFAHCVLRPKIVFEYTEEDDEIWIEEIDPIDTTYLFQEIFVWINLSPESVKDTFFRGRQPPGEGDRVSSPELGNQTVKDPE